MPCTLESFLRPRQFAKPHAFDFCFVFHLQITHTFLFFGVGGMTLKFCKPCATHGLYVTPINLTTLLGLKETIGTQYPMDSH